MMLSRNCTGMILGGPSGATLLKWKLIWSCCVPTTLGSPHPVPSCPIPSHRVQMVAGPRPPWSWHARCQTVLALLGFGQGKGMFPCWHWGWGLCWVIPREGSVALGVQRARLGAQDKNGVKMR